MPQAVPRPPWVPPPAISRPGEAEGRDENSGSIAPFPFSNSLQREPMDFRWRSRDSVARGRNGAAVITRTRDERPPMRSHRICALSLLALGLWSLPCSADFLDQSYVPSSDAGLIVELNQTLAQTFTVGSSGILSRI